MKRIIAAIALSLGLIMCGKDHPRHDLSGSYTLQGVAVVYDTLTGNYTYTVLKSLDVYLRNSADTTGYLVGRKTDNLGRYSFNGIDTTAAYTVYASVNTDTLKYYGELVYPPNKIKNYESDTLKLYPSKINQNGMFIRTLDSTNHLLPYVNVYVFGSKVVWLNSDSTGSTFVIKSDAFGRALKTNLAPGRYYLSAVDSTNKIIIKSRDSFEVKSQDINSKDLILKHG